LILSLVYSENENINLNRLKYTILQIYFLELLLYNSLLEKTTEIHAMIWLLLE